MAAELEGQTGETETETADEALRDRLSHVGRERSGRRLADELAEIAEHCANLPVLDSRSAEEILEFE